MNLRTLLCSICLCLVLTGVSLGQQKPNVVVILADDWGMGDIGCYGGERCRIKTPNMDALAKGGMRFTDAHSSSSVCTPTRYSILTGRYNWRSRMKKGVLGGYSAPLIKEKQVTVADLMKRQGYQTTCIGKWHLGLELPTTDNRRPFANVKKSMIGKQLKDGVSNIDWNGKVERGPITCGFDYYYGISASLDMPPYIWIENDRFVGECTTVKRYGRLGPAEKDFHAFDVLPTIAKKSSEFIAKNAQEKKPFFLYVPLNAPHTPIAPSKRFQGKSGLGTYADFVMETDWAIGQIVDAVEKQGLAENTLVIVTADNGCSPAARRGEKKNGDTLNITFSQGQKPSMIKGRHYPSSIYRGHKADIYEGGHRVPFIASWKGRIKKGSLCHDPVCLVDVFATCRDIVKQGRNEDEGVDSVSFLPLLFETKMAETRQSVVHHSINGSFAIRRGKWKLIFCPGSGGWSNPKPKGLAKNLSEKMKRGEWVQLYDLEKDPSETINVSSDNPKVVAELTAEIKTLIRNGRTTTGPKKSNDGETPLYPQWIRSKKK